MKTKLATAIAFIGLMQSSAIMALGLGDIQVSSAVNERLDAQIPLVNTSGLDASQILVTLASKSEFARAGVDRDYFLTNLEFSVLRSSTGVPVLHVATPDVVLEPYLNFLVEVRWPQGRLLREYTVLLDLPNFSAAPARAVTAATPPDRRADGSASARSTNNSIASRQRAKASPSGPTATSNNTPTAGPDQLTVRANDTLWEIALDIKPAGSSVHQTMLALQQLNPNAFINNNINLLKKGAVLRVPDGSDVASVDARAARQSVKQQQNTWQAGQGSATNYQSGLDARTTPADRTSGAQQSDGHLQLAAGQSATTSSTAGSALAASSAAKEATGNGQLSGEVERLRNELAVSLENLDRASVENSTMDSRLEAMESQLTDLEQLVSLKDQELLSTRAALEARRLALVESGEAVDAGAVEGGLDSTAVEEGFVEDGLVAGAVVETTADAGADDSTQPAEAPVAEVPAVAEELAEAGILASIAKTFSISVELLLGIGIAAIAAIVAFFMWMIGRRQEDYEATVFTPVGELDELLEDDVDSSEEPSFAASEAVDDAVADLDDAAVAVTGDELTTEVAEATLELDDLGLDAELSSKLETGASALADENVDHDPIAEADIYLAYGRHDQAQQMLDRAIEQEPARADLRLKLLEVFVDQNKPAEFKATCQDLLAIDASANIAAEALLADVENSSDWWPVGTVAAPADEFLDSYTDGKDVSDADLGLELDLDSDQLDGAATEVPVEYGLQLAYDADAAKADSELDGAIDSAAEGGQDGEFSRADEVGTKLDLARAYIDMGDLDGAREILDEVMAEGSDEQRTQANSMLGRIA